MIAPWALLFRLKGICSHGRFMTVHLPLCFIIINRRGFFLVISINESNPREDLVVAAGCPGTF